MDKKNYTLSEVIDFVTNGEDSSNVDSDEEEEIVILPPIERAEAKTDCDSDISDDENEGLAHHMSHRLLTAPCSTNAVKQNLDESNQTSDGELCELLPKRQKQKKKYRKWKKADSDSAHDIADPKELPAELSDSIKTLFGVLWNIYSDEYLDIITTQTSICANQHKGLNPPATSEEIKVVISILLLSGYCRVPYRELYWSTSPNIQNESVSRAIARNCFREIFSDLHIWDNTDIDDDRYFKVRPLFDILNTIFKRFVSANNFSVDESMTPYYGRHGTKQFIIGKPLRFGFKLCFFCSSDGHLLHAEPYCGKDTDLPETGLGQGSDVVFDIIEKCDLTKGSTVAVENFFTTLPLLDKLTDMGMSGVSTIRENRLQGAPLKKKAALQKETRETFDYTSDGNNLLVA